MIAATLPIQRPPGAKLLVVNERGEIQHVPRRRFVDLLRPGDLVVANDAATLPASRTSTAPLAGAGCRPPFLRRRVRRG